MGRVATLRVGASLLGVGLLWLASGPSPRAWALPFVISQSHAFHGSGSGSLDQDFSGGSTHAESGPPVVDPQNLARAAVRRPPVFTNRPELAVEARSNSETAIADAMFDDTMSCAAAVCATLLTPGFPPVGILMGIRIQGIIPPFMVPGSSLGDPSFDLLSVRFDAPFAHFVLEGCWDAGPCASNWRAIFLSIDGQDRTNLLTFGTNQQGEATLSFDNSFTRFVDPSHLAFSWLDSLYASAEIRPSGSTRDLALDFFGTFTVDVTSLTPGVSFESEGGWIVPSQSAVPEPSTLSLVLSGMAVMGISRAARKLFFPTNRRAA